MSTVIGPRPEQWIAQGDAVASGSLAAHIGRDGRMREATALAPDVLVFTATPEDVEQLRAEFGSRVVIERNAPIELPPGPGPESGPGGPGPGLPR